MSLASYVTESKPEALNLAITTFRDRFKPGKNKTLSWADLCARLGKPFVSEEWTDAQYHALDSKNDVDALQKLNLKDVGGFVGGRTHTARHAVDDLVDRCVVTLDVDTARFASLMDLDGLLDIQSGKLDEYEWFAHTTRSHTVGAPKIRVVIPLTRPVTPVEYGPLSKALAAILFRDAEESRRVMDAVSYRPAQLMFWPSRNADGDFQVQYNQGAWVDPGAFLASVSDDEWKRLEKLHAMELQDPREKPGFIGAFNRAFYPIGRLFDEELTGLYEKVRDRYKRKGSSGGPGVRIMDGGLHVQSDHGLSDPLSAQKGRNANAYDVARIVLELDHAALQARYGKHERVKAEVEQGRADAADNGFSDNAPVPARNESDFAHLLGDDEPHADDLPKRDFSEAGMIDAFRDRYAGELRFDHDRGRWLKWEGSHWAPDGKQQAHEFARRVSIRTVSLEPTNKDARSLKRVSAWEAVERGARRVAPFATVSKDWDRHQWLLGTPGGTVDLRTGELSPARQKDHITKLTAVAPIPLADFDPERDCPTWLAFLRSALPDDEATIGFLQRWAGYCLTGSTKEEALLFVYGDGGTGKSTFVNTIGDLLADYAVNVDSSTLKLKQHDSHSQEIARLDGPRFARSSETEEGSKWNTKRVTALTGGDKITARFMRQDDFEFKPQFKLTIVGNHAPGLTSVDNAVKRRFIIAAFDVKPAQPDKDLARKLKQEWPAILSWAIRGCLDWQALGDLGRSPKVHAASAAYLNSQDTFALWLEDSCEIGKGLKDTTERLFDSWSHYARQNSEEPGSKNRAFPDRLERHGFERWTDGRVRFFKGLTLVQRDDMEF